MDSEIITKFTVASVQGINALIYLTQTIAREKFLSLLPKEQIENYLSENFSVKTLTDEVNSISNQWLIAYSNENPVGFARITSKGQRPEKIANKRAVRIADFGIIKEFSAPLVRQSLFNSCITVCKSYEAIWINEYLENPFINFFESEGFIRQDAPGELFELPLQSVYLVKQSLRA